MKNVPAEITKRHIEYYLKSVDRIPTLVLDVGCGKGSLLRILSSPGQRLAFSVDLCKSLLKEGQEKTDKPTLIFADARYLPFQ
jgi:ubiquinone/menaquinone biosynthesis C-methylase UbiE